MKKFLLMCLVFFSAMATAVAQEEGEKKEKPDGGRVEALKIAYITKKLDLSSQEAQKFWPIYNEYIKEVRKTRIESRKNKEEEIALEEKLLNIRKRYDGEFAKAIPKEKVNAFFRAEKEFGTVLQKVLMERRQKQMQRRNSRQ